MRAKKKQSRRRILKTGLAGLSGAAFATGLSLTPTEAQQRGREVVKVRYSELLPHEFRSRLAEKPLAYIPLGTLEWHGEHLPLGSDAIQCESLMIECAKRYGGIVLPPVHIGPGPTKLMDDGRLLIGMDFWNNVVDPPRQLDGDCYWIPDGLFISMIDGILAQIKRTGFTAVFADGHGPSRGSWLRELNRREALFGLKLFGVTNDISSKWKSQTDHAALNETSLMMHYRPDLVDISQLSSSRSDWPLGVSGEDPRDATAAHGEQCMNASIELMINKFKEAGV
ncbi:creatininase family protein [Candidatus Latescibacterota bacterium]